MMTLKTMYHEPIFIKYAIKINFQVWWVCVVKNYVGIEKNMEESTLD